MYRPEKHDSKNVFCIILTLDFLHKINFSYDNFNKNGIFFIIPTINHNYIKKLLGFAYNDYFLNFNEESLYCQIEG